MKMRHVSTWALAATLALPVVGLALEACSSEGGSGTTGARVTLHGRATIAPGADTTFTTGLGWSVALTQAQVGLGALEFFAGEPIFSRLAPGPAARDPLGRFFGLGRAWAHPGHYVAGDAMGEMSTAATIDLLAGPTTLADGDGVTGAVRSGRFTYAARLAGDAVAIAAGTATQGARSIPFIARAKSADVLDSYGEPKLEGCVFTAVDVAGDGTITATIDPRVWVDQIDFGRLSPSADGSAVDVATDAIAFNGFARGLKKGTSVAFSFAAP